MLPFFSTSYILVLLQILTLTLTLCSSSPHSFNISHFLYPISNGIVFDPPPPHPNSFLKDVLEAIAEKEKWKDLDGVRVTKLDLKKVKYGTVRRHDFSVKFGNREFVFKLFDKMPVWERIENLNNDSEFEGLVKGIGSTVKLDAIKIEGPFELIVRGDDQLSLTLPLNLSHAGLKRILVSEGITVEVIGAEEVTMFHKSGLHEEEVKGSNSSSFKMSEFGPFWPSSCVALLPIHVLGSVAVLAYRTQNPDAQIKTVFRSRNMIELLPEKCYVRRIPRNQGSPIDSLSRRIALLEKVLSRLVGDRNTHSTSFGYLKAKVKATSVFRFQLELERDIPSNDTYWNTLAEWRTRPTIERLRFESVARFEADTLKPLLVKKVRPIIEVDSLSWSNLLSNISFTKFPSVLVAPESLTLDVKW